MDDLEVKSLKAGDEVGVSEDRGMARLQRVLRVTPSGQVILDDGSRFTPRGYKVGDNVRWHRCRLIPAASARKRAAQTELYKAFDALGDLVGKLKSARDVGGFSGTVRNLTTLTPEERADLLALIERCSAASRCERCNGTGRLFKCMSCDTVYRHINKYSDCGNARCEGERSEPIPCEDCQETQ